MTEKLLSPADLAERWNTSPGTMANWRSAGTGVAYVKVGGLVRYRLSDIEAYERNNRRPTLGQK